MAVAEEINISPSVDGAQDKPLIRVVNVVRRYKMGQEIVNAVAGIDLEIAQGEAVSLVGTSGSGKSTMLNLLGGLDKPTSGDIWVGPTNLATAGKRELVTYRRKQIGFVFQSFNLIPQLSALENVEIPMTLAEIPANQRRQRAKQLLEQVGLGSRVDHRPAQLSGGEQQRVAVARSLANSPQLILADEPTGNLDSANSAAVMQLLLQLNRERNLTLIIVTHDPVVANYADRIVRLRDGKIIGIERPDHSAEANRK